MYFYRPILRWKQGEKVALSNLQLATKNDVVPLFLLGPDQFQPPRGRNPQGTTAAESFVNQVLTVWGTSEFYLDASEIPVQAGRLHPIVDIAAAARVAGLRLIPSTTLGASAAYQAAITTVLGADGRGVALRVDFAEFNSAASWISNWPHSPSDTNLIADFRNTVGVVTAMGAAVTGLFSGLYLGSSWRSVTVAGTSIPADFSGFTAGTHIINRAEWQLWQNLVSTSLPYRLDFGDYATVSLAAAPPTIAWGYPINVKYTLSGQFLVCKGIKTTGRGAIDMAPQLIGHATSIVAHPSRSRIAGCWGDDRIDAIASGTENPGNLGKWVGFSVNRHVERLRLDLP